MSNILDILTAQGLSLQAVTSGRGIDPAVRKVYDALNNGSSVAYVFGDTASESLLEQCASTEDAESGEAVVLHSHEFNVDTLRRKVNYRNANHVNKAGKPYAKVTLGAVQLSSNITDADGNAVGFLVRK